MTLAQRVQRVQREREKTLRYQYDNLHETPEFGHRAKLAWTGAKRGASDLNLRGRLSPADAHTVYGLRRPGSEALGIQREENTASALRRSRASIGTSNCLLSAIS
jgi:hypothetical protein